MTLGGGGGVDKLCRCITGTITWMRKERSMVIYWMDQRAGWLSSRTYLQIRLFGDELNVTTEGQRHLGAVIGSSDLRQLVTLTPAQGGLGVPDLRFEAPQQFAASTSITAPHVDSITTQSMFMVAGENSTKESKSNIKPWNCLGEIKNGNYWCHSTHGSAAVS